VLRRPNSAAFPLQKHQTPTDKSGSARPDPAAGNKVTGVSSGILGEPPPGIPRAAGHPAEPPPVIPRAAGHPAGPRRSSRGPPVIPRAAGHPAGPRRSPRGAAAVSRR